MRNRNDDLTSRWDFNPKNPRGPMPDNKQAESYADKDAREYYLLDLYGRQDRPQPSRKKETAMKVKPRRAKRRPVLEAVIITEILILSLLGGVFVSILIWNRP